MISIIIPVFNEADTIGKLLSHLIENSSQKNISDIIVVDGGSNDGTQDIVTSMLETETNSGLIQIKASTKGRAIQMNKGAKQTSASILYFLHADCLPPRDFDQLIINEVEKGNPAGCFKMRFNHDHWWLRLASWLTQFHWRACRGGDQSQFITKSLFDEIEGYDEDYFIYEDNILINELFKRNQFVVIQEWITTSARLYERIGIWTLQYHFWTIYVKRWFGASADDIFNYYKKHIAK